MGLRLYLRPINDFTMDFSVYERKFRVKAVNVGYSEDEIRKCLNYAKPLLEKDLPVIYNTANLSALVGYKREYLKKAALFNNRINTKNAQLNIKRVGCKNSMPLEVFHKKILLA